ncbi:ferritin-like domain-containing protein [Ditylenchus destructor]|nr:ferritin-like domain-containing protein [Ditylenchus destructor]
MTSQIRQNFQDDCINGINNLINMYMSGSYSCTAAWQYLTRDDVALRNIASFFEALGHIKSQKAKELISYMNKRGGRVVLKEISQPDKAEWSSVLEVFEKTLECDKAVNKELLNLHDIAEKNHDWQMCDFLEKEFLQHMVKHLEELGWIITNLRRVGKGLGEFMVDTKYFTCTGKVHSFN